MTDEDEEFNRIEREAKQRMEAVKAALDRKAENARELGLDYEPVPENFMDALKFDVAMREWVGLTDEERNHARQTVTYSQLAMTAGEWAEKVQIETERRLKEKNT